MITRCFSALEPVWRAQQWPPRGMPGFYKLLDGLSARGLRADVVLLVQVPDSGVERVSVFTVPGLVHRFHVVPLFGPTLRRRRPLGRLSQWLYCWRLYRRGAYRLVYGDGSNAMLAGALGWIARRPIVLRLFGASPLTALIEGPRPWLRLPLRLALRAPFRQVICTLDGSDARRFQARYLRPGVPFVLRINGVDRPPAAAPGPARSTPVLLFVGRLERGKGGIEFLEVVRRLRARGLAFRAVVIGDGPARRDLESVATREGLGNVVAFRGAVAHTETLAAYAEADLFVSINRYGLLGNTLLEALAAGCCVVAVEFPRRDRLAEADSPLPSECIVRAGDEDVVDRLVERLDPLIADGQRRGRQAELGRARAAAVLKSWEERIGWEVDMLTALAGLSEAAVTEPPHPGVERVTGDYARHQ